MRKLSLLLTLALFAVTQTARAQSLIGRNLIVNGDGETGTGITTTEATAMAPPSGWKVKGTLTLAQYGGANLLAASEELAPKGGGVNYFSGGNSSAPSSGAQTVDLSAEAAAIDGGSVLFALSGYLGADWAAHAEFKATFKDGAGKTLLVTNLDTVTPDDREWLSGMLYRITRGQIPIGARSVDLQLDMIPDAQAYNLAEADNLSLVLTNGKLWGVNLIENGDAEAVKPSNDTEIVRPTPRWNTRGTFSQVAYGIDGNAFLGKDDPGPTARGLAYFWGATSQLASGFQLIDLGGVSQTVDTGSLTFSMTGWLGGAADQPCTQALRLRYLDKDFNPLYDQTLTPNRGGKKGLFQVSVNGSVPAGARRIELSLVFDMNGGIDLNYGFADNISLVITNPVSSVTIKDRGIVNAASLSFGAVAPGEIVSVFGEGLGPALALGMEADQNGKLLTARGGVRVLINSVAAPLYLAQSGQINVQVPLEVTGTTTTMVVDNNGARSGSVTIDVAGAAPGVFTVDGSGKGQVWMLNGDLTANGTGNGAASGASVTFFCTGLGALDGSAATGQMLTGGSVPKTKSAVTVRIGGQAATVSFAGAIPYGWPGLYQVIATVPSGLTAGPQAVVVTAGNVSSPAGTTMVVK